MQLVQVVQVVTAYAVCGFVAAGIAVVAFVALSDWIFWMKCAKWCERRGLKCMRIETNDGGYGYVAYDPERARWYQIPSDFGELDECRSIGSRMREFDWKGTDKVAVEKDGTTIPLDFVKKNEVETKKKGIV